ncbi:MFS transporter [Paractinoplanes rishiriensis]|uniref:MFS transporter n=1 Tax=Paractinoplanes rishiriensis TaxID=1050105 RepID=A0A919K2V8_9ACTN|nr:MFS transporter [Actinoplanes rishiriensis]GIE97990.1 MFS transporter [Actinoplanes rishiriensis]
MNRSALVALGGSTFCYVAAETLPIGLLPQIAGDLEVAESDVGLLLTSYAVVAAVSTIPLTALTMRVPRHRLIAITVAVFAVSQFAAALAPTFLLLTLARLVCALAHGVFWSVLAPVTARLAPPGRAGRATALVFVGNSLAVVAGVPLGTALGQWLGWRVAVGAFAAGGAICVLLLWRLLPAMDPLPRDRNTRVGTQLLAAVTIVRDRRVLLLCLTTVAVVVGHFAAYTYLAPLARRNGDLEGLGLSALLLGYGAVGLIASFTVGRFVDRRPGPALTGLLAVMAVSVALLAPVLGTVPTVIATVLWGGAFGAMPVCLTATVLRVAPRARDAASALHVVSFQIGIGGGAFVGERLTATGHLGVAPLLAAGLALVALLLVVSARQVFPVRLDEEEHRRVEAALVG